MISPQHIIISRTDNIGDVVFTLPIATLLKQHYPNCIVSFLTRDYVQSIVTACFDVDHFISWDELKNLSSFEGAAFLKTLQADTLLHVFPNKKIAKLAKLANIKTRIGTSHRWYHWLTCNKRVNFSRKDSLLHEAQLNLKLLEPFAINTDITVDDLQFLLRLVKAYDISSVVGNLLVTEKFNLVLHPLTNGNTKEWSLEKFSALIQILPSEHFNIILTGMEKERGHLQSLLTAFPDIKDAIGNLSLAEFMQLLSHAGGIVANSTGPLHIGAALGIHALGLYPTEKGKDEGRWGPLGKQTQVLSADDMDSISVPQVWQIIEKWY